MWFIYCPTWILQMIHLFLWFHNFFLHLILIFVIHLLSYLNITNDSFKHLIFFNIIHFDIWLLYVIHFFSYLNSTNDPFSHLTHCTIQFYLICSHGSFVCMLFTPHDLFIFTLFLHKHFYIPLFCDFFPHTFHSCYQTPLIHMYSNRAWYGEMVLSHVFLTSFIHENLMITVDVWFLCRCWPCGDLNPCDPDSQVHSEKRSML